MLSYKLFADEEKELVYYYYPERKPDEMKSAGNAGIVTIDKLSGDVSIKEMSKDDFENWYAFHLTKRLKEFYQAGSYREEGTIMWY